MRKSYLISLMLLLAWLLLICATSEAQDNCTVLPCEDAVYCPDMWVNIDGEWAIISTTVPVSCYIPVETDDEDGQGEDTLLEDALRHVQSMNIKVFGQ